VSSNPARVYARCWEFIHYDAAILNVWGKWQRIGGNFGEEVFKKDSETSAMSAVNQSFRIFDCYII
jgi:hypothetical protein